MPTHHRPLAALALTLLVAGLAPTTALAQTSGVINACSGKSLGTLRLVDAGTTCRTGETLVSWNVQGQQGPAGETGPAGPAGPQFSLAASIRGDGTVEVLTAPPGASLTVARVAAGTYNISVTGLGSGCPLPTATAFHAPTVMWLGSGSCGGGVLALPVHAGNGTDNAFILSVTSQGPTAAKPTRAAPTTALGQ